MSFICFNIFFHRNFGLLSFGEEAEEDEGEAQEYRGKPKSTHDLLEDPKLSRKTAAGNTYF